MALIVHLEEPIQREMRVTLGRRQARMAEHFLDSPEVGATLEHVRSTRMTERVRMQIRTARAERPIAVHELLDPAHGHAMPEPPDEERGRLEEPAFRVPELDAPREIRGERLVGLATERDDSLFAPLAEHADALIAERHGRTRRGA